MTDEAKPKSVDATDEIKNVGEALIKIAAALKQLPDDASRVRVVRAIAVLHDVTLDERIR